MESAGFDTGIEDRLRDLLDSDPSVVDTVEFINLLNDPGLDLINAAGILAYRWNNAAINLKRIIELDARLYKAMDLFTKCASAVGAYQDAEILIKRAIDAFSYDAAETASLSSLYAGVLQRRGRFAEAELEYKKAIELDRSNPAYYFEYAKFLYWRKMHNKARKVIQTMVAIIPPGTKSRNLFKKVLKGEEGLDAILAQSPSYGCIVRFSAKNNGLIEKFSRQLGTNNRASGGPLGRDGVRRYAGIEGDEMIRKELDKLEMRIKAEKSENQSSRLSDEYIDFLEGIRPGFQVKHCLRYFHDRCGKCAHPEGALCALGFSNCPLDPAFYEYVRETARKAVDLIKKGNPIDSIEELRLH